MTNIQGKSIPDLAPIRITISAASKMFNMSEESGGRKPRIGVIVGNKGGCMPMRYDVSLVDSFGKGDEKVDCYTDSGEKITIGIASDALFYLFGSEVDYEKKQFSEGFIFKNPNVKDSCACGGTFEV